jgi:hypothetical protein
MPPVRRQDDRAQLVVDDAPCIPAGAAIDTAGKYVIDYAN